MSGDPESMGDLDRHPVVIVLATMLGTMLLWCKEANRGAVPKKLAVYAMTPIMERLIPQYEKLRYVLQLLVFVSIGTVVALLFTKPITAEQGFAAGLGWTAALAKNP